MEKQRKELENLLKAEESEIFQVKLKDIKNFLTHLRYGNIQSIKYKQMIVNVLVYEVYLYNDHLIIIYTIQNEDGERVISKIPSISKLENLFKNKSSSFLGKNAEPIRVFVELFE